MYTAQRSIEVKSLGSQAHDLDIYVFSKQAQCILVTLNGIDFAKLCVRYGPIPIIVLPSVPPRTQHAYLRWITPVAERVFSTSEGRFVEISATGRAFSYRVQRGLNWDARSPLATTIPASSTLIH